MHLETAIGGYAMQKNSKHKMKYRNIFNLILVCLLFISILTSCSLDRAIVSLEQNVNRQSDIKNTKDEVVEQRVTVTQISNVVPIKTLELKWKVTPTGKPKAALVLKLKAKVTATPTPKPKTKITPTPKPKTKKIVTPTPKPKKRVTVTPTPKPVAKVSATPTPKPTVTVTITPTPAIVPTSTSIITPPLRSKNETIEEYTQKILKLIIQDDMSEVEKVKAVHDYIVLNCEYDIDNYKNDKIPDSSYAAEGVLWKGKAVCQGYAYAFQLFMEKLGIDSKIITGLSLKSGEGHAWNLVSLGGKWYQVDTTWDDPVPDQTGMVQYSYFLMTDTIVAADHGWKKSNYPACSSEKYIYYIYKDNIINSIDDYEAEFVKRFNKGQKTITLLYPEKVIPSMDFLLDYENMRTETVEGNKTTYSYKCTYYPAWRLGDYTVYTVIME